MESPPRSLANASALASMAHWKTPFSAKGVRSSQTSKKRKSLRRASSVCVRSGASSATSTSLRRARNAS
eukprot:scaffold609_cov234-Pinguiococcus_pyrenoidosus.AAC.3